KEVTSWMKSMSFNKAEINYVSKLVRWHQWRFYDDTTERAYRSFILRFGAEHWKDIFDLRIADRAGNQRIVDTGRPLQTNEYIRDYSICERIVSNPNFLFFEDINYSLNKVTPELKE